MSLCPYIRCRRIIPILLSIVLISIVSIIYFREAIAEIPDRWHAPYFNPEPASSLKSPINIFDANSIKYPPAHPIDGLTAGGQELFEATIEKQTSGIAGATEAYIKRRGRRPPPRFDEWVQFAERHDCIVIEDFFDRIYHDLNPFWGMQPLEIRAHATSSHYYIRIRGGKITRSEKEVPFIASYYNMIKQVAQHLPDIDISINSMDEPRVLVPSETIDKHMSGYFASLPRHDLTRPPKIDYYPVLTASTAPAQVISFDAQGASWSMARQACPNTTGASFAPIDTNYSTPPIFPQAHPFGTYDGFVSNWTISQDVCSHPHLRNMHGSFVEPISMSTATKLLPIFSGSKMLVNNDILLPAAMYWSDDKDTRFAAGTHRLPWKSKRNEVFWRGTGSGGRNTANNWTRFQRHRLVSMLNGTQIELSLRPNITMPTNLPHNFPLPNNNLYPLQSTKVGLLAEWIRSLSNVAFYWLECFPPTTSFGCSYTGSWYRRGRQVSMERMFLNKYLPDIDGNSFSGRFRAFLLSNSLPIKATIYTEWHDSRLVPWMHFAPMDNTFVDLWSILEYFILRDEKAEKMAIRGREWAEKVLRKEDMLVYVYRLLLEYARVSHPERVDIGYWGKSSK